MKMTKNEYLRSMARHATLLCCIVPFIAAVSAQAEGSYNWSGSNENVSDLEITLTQSVNIQESGQPIDIAKFDKNSFSSTFESELRGIDASLPNYSNWTLSQVIIEVSGSASSITFTTDLPAVNIIAAGDPTVKIGNFILENGTSDGASVEIALKPASGLTGSYLGDTRTDNQDGTYSWTINSVSAAANSQNVDKNLFDGGGDLNLTLDDNFGFDGVAYQEMTGFNMQTFKPEWNTVSNPNVSVDDLGGVNLTLNIKYIVTPEPGTMALLLTGIPLFLVRRRKSWKK